MCTFFFPLCDGRGGESGGKKLFRVGDAGCVFCVALVKKNKKWKQVLFFFFTLASGDDGIGA